MVVARAGSGRYHGPKSFERNCDGEVLRKRLPQYDFIATAQIPTKGAEMKSKKLAAKVATTATVVLITITTLSAGASATSKQVAHNEGAISIAMNRGAPSTRSSRLSGLPFGGAALYDGAVPYNKSAFHNGGADPLAVKQSVPDARSSRLSGLMFGGATLYL